MAEKKKQYCCARALWVLLLCFIVSNMIYTDYTIAKRTTEDGTIVILKDRIYDSPDVLNVEVVVLKDGIYDSPDVLNAITSWSLAVKTSMNLTCSIIKLLPENNSPRGLDVFIEERHAENVHIFILVGNDLKWPVFSYVNGRAPASGILSDTDGELDLFGRFADLYEEGYNSIIIDYHSEVTVSYVFPPKYSSYGELLAEEVQQQDVVDAFNKFQRYHEGLISYSPMGVISGNFDFTYTTVDNEAMYNASVSLFGANNTVLKELNRTEVVAYLRQGPTYFVANGHGTYASAQTSSKGGNLYTIDLKTDDKTPLFMEIGGCWTAGYVLQNMTDPWGAKERYLSGDAIFSNNYTVAIVAGIPETGTGGGSSNGTSWYYFSGFSRYVLSEMSKSPMRSIGELMLGQKRPDGYWAFFGDPTIRFGNLYEPEPEPTPEPDPEPVPEPEPELSTLPIPEPEEEPDNIIEPDTPIITSPTEEETSNTIPSYPFEAVSLGLIVAFFFLSRRAHSNSVTWGCGRFRCFDCLG